MNKYHSSEELRELVDLTAEQLGLSLPFVVEKDFYVTHAIHALSSIENNYFHLVFQGGTCLAKAHRVVQRMSEDCDFRIATNSAAHSLSKEAFRKQLRVYRTDLLNTLRTADFICNEDAIQVGNEGQFMRVRLQYQALYPVASSLKPHILLEFILVNTKLPSEKLPVTTLIQQTLGDNVGHDIKAFACVSVLETAAEKWVALTRRVACIDRGYSKTDQSLIRHLYDLHRIHKSQILDERFPELVRTIISEDKERYRNHSPEYFDSPLEEIKQALKALEDETIWREQWQHFINAMVFQKNPPSYQVALATLMQVSQNIVA